MVLLSEVGTLFNSVSIPLICAGLGLLFRNKLKVFIKEFIKKLFLVSFPKEPNLRNDFLDIIVNGIYFSYFAVMISISSINYFTSDQVLQSISAGFLASLMQDVFLFTVIGFGLVYANRKISGDDEFKTRIKSFLNRDGLKGDTKERIVNEISRFLVFCDRMDLVFSFDEYDEDLNAVRVVCSCHKTYLNPFKDLSIADDNYKFTLDTDNMDFSNSHRTSYKKNGQILHVSVKYDDQGKVIPIVSKHVDVEKSKVIPYKIKCPEAGGFSTDFKSWVWNELGNCYIWTTTRFTKHIAMTLINETGHDLTLEINGIFAGGDGSDITVGLTGDDSLCYYADDVSLGARHLFNIKKEQ